MTVNIFLTQKKKKKSRGAGRWRQSGVEANGISVTFYKTITVLKRIDALMQPLDGRVSALETYHLLPLNTACIHDINIPYIDKIIKMFWIFKT